MNKILNIKYCISDNYYLLIVKIYNKIGKIDVTYKGISC